MSAEKGAAPPGLLLCDDLVFASRIAAAAAAAGREVKQARSVDQLVGLAARLGPRRVLVDLGFPGLDLAELFRRLGEACPAPPRVLAYGAHVDAAGLRAARAAGCDPVLPRSKFVEDLPRALPAWLGAE
jgi:DNA-binding NarL/FixJ family response regulator